MESLLDIVLFPYLAIIVMVSYAIRTGLEESKVKLNFSFYFVVVIVGAVSGAIYYWIDSPPFYKIVVTFGMAAGFYKLLFQWWIEYLKDYIKSKVSGSNKPVDHEDLG